MSNQIKSLPKIKKQKFKRGEAQKTLNAIKQTALGAAQILRVNGSGGFPMQREGNKAR